MELRHLRYYVAVAEELSFSRAASRLNISQPPLSRQIRELEEELGIDLFTRTSRSVRLTPAGRAFLPKARTVLHESRSALEEARKWAAGHHETITIGFMSAVMLTSFHRFMKPFHEKFPAVSIKLVQMRSDEQLAAILDSRIDAGFVDFGLDLVGDRLRNNKISTDRFLHEELCAVVPKEHPLSRRKQIDLSELKDESFAILERHLFPSHHDLVIAECNRAGFTPKINHFADQIPSVLTYVAAGMAVAISPRLAEASWQHFVSFISIKTRPHINIHMISRENSDAPGLARLRTIMKQI